VVVDEIDIECVAILETEHDTPIAGYRERPIACQIAAQTVTAQSWQPVDLIGIHCVVQQKQGTPNACNLILLQSAGVVPFEETAQPSLAEGLDHRLRNMSWR
jgi:hypothetical protein